YLCNTLNAFACLYFLARRNLSKNKSSSRSKGPYFSELKSFFKASIAFNLTSLSRGSFNSLTAFSRSSGLNVHTYLDVIFPRAT
uniref:Uncharacterized protein n=1 Tax=Ciona intestinalis TaxID=7719 RepID=H2XWS9_CIOIN